MISDRIDRFGYPGGGGSGEPPLRALLADDDRLLLEIARGYIERLGFELDTVPDGPGAWELLRSRTYAIAIVDLEMPRMNGFELLQRIRYDARHAGMPVAVLTGRPDLAVIDRAFALGANAFLKKPVNWTVFSFRVRDLVHAATHDPLLAPRRA
jgi:DNA-binding response OmpR family regulator